jgi:hypothetical protein
MTPDDLKALLTGDWPPPSAHWPPNDKATWREGMTLIGVIETTKQLPRAERYAKTPGQKYTAVVLRRCSDGRRVTYHGYRTADEDLDGMPLDPGLLFGVVYRGEGKGGFEDFKHWTTTYTPPAGAPATPPAVEDQPRQEPERRQPVTREAQAEATATRNGHAAPPARPEPGTAARHAALADPYDAAGVPTIEAIAAVRSRDDGQALVKGASQAFKQAVKQQGARRPPHGAGLWGALWNSTDPALWQVVLGETRRALLGQEAPA